MVLRYASVQDFFSLLSIQDAKALLIYSLKELGNSLEAPLEDGGILRVTEVFFGGRGKEEVVVAVGGGGGTRVPTASLYD